MQGNHTTELSAFQALFLFLFSAGEAQSRAGYVRQPLTTRDRIRPARRGTPVCRWACISSMRAWMAGTGDRAGSGQGRALGKRMDQIRATDSENPKISNYNSSNSFLPFSYRFLPIFLPFSSHFLPTAEGAAAPLGNTIKSLKPPNEQKIIFYASEITENDKLASMARLMTHRYQLAASRLMPGTSIAKCGKFILKKERREPRRKKPKKSSCLPRKDYWLRAYWRAATMWFPNGMSGMWISVD